MSYIPNITRQTHRSTQQIVYGIAIVTRDQFVIASRPLALLCLKDIDVANCI